MPAVNNDKLQTQNIDIGLYFHCFIYIKVQIYLNYTSY